MSATEDPVSIQLHALAERWLKRPLTAAEEQVLARFRQTLGGGRAAVSGPPAAQAAARAVRDARQQAQAAIQGVLENARQLTQRMASEREQEDRAVLQMVESARSLAELRPASLAGGGRSTSPAGQLAIAQIADRLANLVRSEVQACFEQRLSPLASRIEALLAETQSAQAPASIGQHPSQNSSEAAGR